jgi:hypothetical protein
MTHGCLEVRPAFMITRLFSSALLVATATGCAAQPIDRHSILRLDACGDEPLDEPVDLGRRAQEAGCATSSIGGWGVLGLTVEAVVSPREFLVISRYGRERIRPAYNAGAADALRSLDAQQLEELGARLESALAGQVLLEPNSAYAPVVADDGLRVVALYGEDMHSLDEVIQATTRAMPRGRERLPVTIEDGIDLSRVPEAADARQQRVAAAVDLAEHFSAFRAPPSLTVAWVTSAQVPHTLRARDDGWGELLVTCFGEEVDAQDDVVRNPS